MISYIHQLIDNNCGSISISNFMDNALYHTEYGYYMNKLSIGKSGDFITSPDISQLFGEIIAVWIVLTWEKLGKPSQFSLVELGPGNGTLIYDIVRVTTKYIRFFHAMSIHLVEISPTLQKKQQITLQNLNIHWHKNLDQLPIQPTIFLANEFFDSLPIDQFIYYNEDWYENRVIKKDQSLALSRQHIHPKKYTCIDAYLNSQFDFLDDAMQSYSWNFMNENQWYDKVHNLQVESNITNWYTGAVLEICWLAFKMLRALEKKIYDYKGAAIIIDYGYIYSSYKNTIQSIKQHQYNNFLENVGSSDITSFVNFQALKDSLEFLECHFFTQREFLYLFGIKERLHILMNNKSHHQQKQKLLSAFLRLTENMGTIFKVMIIEKL
ncbi:class I SAM-dependent methyltransferase [Wolbachia endosymbiont of Howardula sp.]|uniref:class I SAM-dependent methyltransferase n=1 Tax=Wolbachia endosymbiont of Howardula sp. TaxID=2916816 RepID=UPI00217E2DEA|nr:SAM-dependent methyltransferase [Wolbachia endosymbiont of Howardula sp.]UWI83013.1 SAM-dependent methyltransferase [Wolbachia endosymbiont of Howardula sp.]